MRPHARPALLAAGVLLFAFFGLISSCSDNPTATSTFASMEGGGKIDPGAGDEILLSTVDMGPGFQGFVEVWAYDLAAESDSVVGFDLVILNRTNGDIPPPLLFLITSIVPNTVTCFNPDGYMRDRIPFYDLSDDLGNDGLLTPGEATAPVRVRFRSPAPMAFSIGFRLSIGEIVRHGMIAGVVFHDHNENGIYDERFEPGIPDVAVRLQTAPGDSAANARSVVVRTDRDGRYAFAGLPAGVYKIEALLLTGLRPTTPNPLLVALVKLPDGTVSSFLGAHFGVAAVAPPPPPVWVFGPVPVGPASPFRTRVDSTFAIPPPMPPFPPEGDIYYVRVEPPPVLGPYPMFINQVTVTIDNRTVYKFECHPDTLCPPRFERIAIDPALTGEGEHKISIEVLGSELTFLLVGIEHGIWREIGPAARR